VTVYCDISVTVYCDCVLQVCMNPDSEECEILTTEDRLLAVYYLAYYTAFRTLPALLFTKGRQLLGIYFFLYMNVSTATCFNCQYKVDMLQSTCWHLSETYCYHVGRHLTSRKPLSVNWKSLNGDKETSGKVADIFCQVLDSMNEHIVDCPSYWAIIQALLDLQEP